MTDYVAPSKHLETVIAVTHRIFGGDTPAANDFLLAVHYDEQLHRGFSIIDMAKSQCVAQREDALRILTAEAKKHNFRDCVI